jgi:hypothetical protein
VPLGHSDRIRRGRRLHQGPCAAQRSSSMKWAEVWAGVEGGGRGAEVCAKDAARASRVVRGALRRRGSRQHLPRHFRAPLGRRERYTCAYKRLFLRYMRASQTIHTHTHTRRFLHTAQAK